MPLRGMACSFLEGCVTTAEVAVTGTIRVAPCAPLCAADLTSSSVTLPCGPPPFRVEISTLSSLARRRVAGVARTRAVVVVVVVVVPDPNRPGRGAPGRLVVSRGAGEEGVN